MVCDPSYSAPVDRIAGRRRRRSSCSGDAEPDEEISACRPFHDSTGSHPLQRVLAENPRVLDLLTTREACVLRRVDTSMRAAVAEHPWCDLATTVRNVGGLKGLPEGAAGVRFDRGLSTDDALRLWARCFRAATGVCIYTAYLSEA